MFVAYAVLAYGMTLYTVMYAVTSLIHQIQRAALIPHPQALQPCPRQQQPRHVPLVTTYHPRFTSLTKIVNKHLPILDASKKLKQAILNRLLVTFRQPSGPLGFDHTCPFN